ncbi:MAG: hypothetical protein ACK4HE_11635 [Chitinophagaceae bacterium]
MKLKFAVRLSVFFVVVILLVQCANKQSKPATVAVATVESEAFKHITEAALVQKWWPGKVHAMQLTDNNFEATITTTFHGTRAFNVRWKGATYNTLLMVLPGAKDSTIVKWIAAPNTVPLPAALNAQLQVYLNRLQQFLSNSINIYGYAITEGRMKDTVFIATKKTYSYYPTTNDYYAQIASLRAYAQQQHVAVTDSPMVHVFKDSNGQFIAMTALPIQYLIPETNTFFIKRMILGKNINGVVRGGEASVLDGLQQLERYKSNYNYTSPAIPYQSLIVNRLAVKDTTQWKTKLIYPVM